MVAEEINDSSDEETHELQPLQTSTSSAHLRHKSSISPKRNRSGRRDNDSEEYDEDFADETFQLRGPDGTSLDLDKDKNEDNADDVEQTLLGGSSPSAAKVAIDSSDPSALVASVVSDTDDPTQTALTARGILIGTFFCILGAGLNQVRSIADVTATTPCSCPFLALLPSSSSSNLIHRPFQATL